MPTHADQPEDAVPIRNPVPAYVGPLLIGIGVLVVIGIFLTPLGQNDVAEPTPLPTPTTEPTVKSDALSAPLASRFLLTDGTEIATTSGGEFRVEPGWGDVFELALQEFLESPNLIESEDARMVLLFGCPLGQQTCEAPLGGLTITLTIDLYHQTKAQEVRDGWAGHMVDTSLEILQQIIVVDNTTGEITAWSADAGGRRPAGTLAHTVVASAGLEAGFGLDSEWDASSPQTFNLPDSSLDCANAGGGSAGVQTLEDSMIRSLNVVHCGVAVEVGIEALNESAEWFGIPKGSDVAAYADGRILFSPLEVAQGFLTIANFGNAATPHVIANVSSPRGDVLWSNPPPEPFVIDPALAASLHQALSQVPTPNGTAPRADIGSPQGGQTGTASNFAGVWYAGYTPDLTTVIWIGPPAGSNLTNVEIRGQTYSRVFGGAVPAPMWAELMSQLVDPAATFPPTPPGMDQYMDGGS